MSLLPDTLLRCDIKVIKQMWFAKIEDFKEGKRTGAKSPSVVLLFLFLFGVCAL